MVLFLNIFRLLPYVFTLTAHIFFTFTLVLPFWLGFIFFTLNKNINKRLRHLVPVGTPIALSQFIVIIELVSQIIRPITLSVRLAANITAGHILIRLCRRNTIIINLSRLSLILLLVLETAVAFIQRYVIITLINIYLREAYVKTTSPISYSF